MNPFTLLSPIFVFIIAFHSRGTLCRDPESPVTGDSVAPTATELASAEPGSEASEEEEFGELDAPDPDELFDLDINITETTPFYDYEHDPKDNSHTFRAKPGYKFSKILKGLHLLKECADTEVPDAVVAGHTDNKDVLLSVYYRDSHNLAFYVAKDPDVTASEESQEQYLSFADTSVTVVSDEPTEHPRVVTSSDDKRPENFEVEDRKNRLKYTFNKHAKCTEVRHDDKPLWRHDKARHGEHFPTALLLNTNTKFLLIESEGKYQYFFSFVNAEWRHVFDCAPSARAVDVNKLVLMTLNSNGAKVPMDAGAYHTDHSNQVHTFTLNSDAKCTEVRYGDDLFWKHNKKEHGSSYPKTVSVNTASNFVMVDAPDEYRYLYRLDRDGWKCIFGYKAKDSTQVYPGRFKIYTLNSDNSLSENDREKYFVTHSNNLLTVTFNSKAKCDEVIYDDVTVWRHDPDDHQEEYPTSLSLRTSRNLLVVDAATKYRHMYAFHNNAWVELPFGFKARDVQASKLTLVTKADDGSVMANDETKYVVEQHQNVLIFKFKDGARCTEVKYDEDTLWKHNAFEHGDNYPTFVGLNSEDKRLLVECTGEYSYPFEYHGFKWEAALYGFRYLTAHVGNFMVVTNVGGESTHNDTSQYSLHHTANLLTVKFNDDAKCTEVRYDDKPLWRHDKARHGEHFPTALLLNTANGYFMVESHLKYQYFYTFKHGAWAYTYGYKHGSTKEPLSLANFTFHTTDDEFRYSDLWAGKYTLEPKGGTGAVKFRFSLGSKACLVKSSGEELWKHNKKMHGENYLTSMTLDPDLGTVTFESVGNYCDVHAYDSTWIKSTVDAAQWEQTEEEEEAEQAEAAPPGQEGDPRFSLPAKPPVLVDKLIELNIKKNDNTHQFKYLTNARFKLGTYVPVNGYAFNWIREDTVPVWKSKSPSLYATRVAKDGLGLFSSINNVMITFSNHKTKRYIKYADRWVELRTGILVDVGVKASGYRYECTKAGTTYYFTPHEGYAFRKVFIDKYLRYGSNNPGEFAERVDMRMLEDGYNMIIHVNDDNLRKPIGAEPC